MRVAIVTDPQSHSAGETIIAESLQEAFAGQISPLETADVVISTSRAAARNVTAPLGSPHICYLADTNNAPQSHLMVQSPQRLKPSTLELSAVSATPTETQATVSPGHQGITHYLAGNGIAANQLRQAIDRPVKVISPAIDTQPFRPQKLRRSEHYLLIIDEGNISGLEVAIAASHIAGRELVVVTEPNFELPDLLAEQSHVQFVTADDDSDLYQYLCECRALLCLSSGDFDANVIRAQACGTPVIVPAGGGIEELILDAEQEGPGTGLLFEPSTPESIASAMLEYERRPHKCSAMLASAHAQAFSPTRFAEEIHAFVEAVVNSTVRAVADEPFGGEQRRAA
ncbi:D-inositol-3-phosphate glycosyltransferase [Symmachiella macrocystis]|uniref:D-inositol-3-phosphate glycosyltransferase n=1 Tax=Symmachiella macrocystis TaxID=2527985 RepID=A0A5C6BC73_9PLAN|nr:glycosyltransferase [Symmachiella macrocystis]TWU09608.1 D-inositol-3-phosphate glycosyltransferase [Symmachiella macrocystis]